MSPNDFPKTPSWEPGSIRSKLLTCVPFLEFILNCQAMTNQHIISIRNTILHRRIQYRKLANGGSGKKGGSGKSSPVPGAVNNASERAPTPTPTSELAPTPTPTPTSATTTPMNAESTLLYSPVDTNIAVAGTSGETPAAEPTKNITPEAETANHDNKVPAFLTEAGYIDDKASGVANWTAEQAQSFRLTDARRKRLDEVGFCWSAREGNEKATLETRIARNSYDDQWDAMFIQLEEYKRAKGDCLVPKRYPENPKLGTVCAVAALCCEVLALSENLTIRLW